MTRLAKLQIIGPIVLALTIAAEEIAAGMLAWKPSSEFAWYLNLHVFGIFQRSHYMLSEYFGVPYFQLLFIALPIVLLASTGIGLRARLPVAVASNLSFAYAFFLAYSWYGTQAPAPRAASLGDTAYDSVFNLSALNLTLGPHVYVLAALIIPALFSAAASHLMYFRAVRGR